MGSPKMDSESPPMSADLEEHFFHQNGQDWSGTWFPPGNGPPEGKRHGATGICLAEDGRVVLVSEGASWDFPEGAPKEMRTGAKPSNGRCSRRHVPP